MKRIKYVALLVVAMGFISACELDNLEGPTAELYGSIIDAATGELVQQDIIRGTVIELREFGYDPVAPQELIVQNDGTYRNSRLFANTYTVEPLRTNFRPVDPQDVEITGSTRLDFMVTPYIRVNDVVITKTGDVVTATFSLEQTTLSNVKRIGLYAHPDPHVGEPMQIARTQQDINAMVEADNTFTLELDTSTDPDLVAGRQYFFRVGALSNEPEARFNYAPAVSIIL
jgi:hypothetical protein